MATKRSLAQSFNEIKHKTRDFAQTLNEKDRRHFVAIETNETKTPNETNVPNETRHRNGGTETGGTAFNGARRRRFNRWDSCLIPVSWRQRRQVRGLAILVLSQYINAA